MQILHKIRGWAEERNLIKGSSPQAQMVKLMEEIGELASGIAKNDQQKIMDSIGDAVVVLTIIAAQRGAEMSGCINMAWEDIKDRKGRMIDGVFVKESDLPPDMPSEEAEAEEAALDAAIQEAAGAGKDAASVYKAALFEISETARISAGPAAKFYGMLADKALGISHE